MRYGPCRTIKNSSIGVTTLHTLEWPINLWVMTKWRDYDQMGHSNVGRSPLGPHWDPLYRDHIRGSPCPLASEDTWNVKIIESTLYYRLYMTKPGFELFTNPGINLTEWCPESGYLWSIAGNSSNLEILRCPDWNLIRHLSKLILEWNILSKYFYSS